MDKIDSKPDDSLDDQVLNRLTKQVAKGGGISLLGQFGGKVIKFLFEIFLTNIFGVRDYGLYSLGISQSFSQLGLHNGVVRFGSIYYGEKDRSKLKGTILVSLILSFSAGIVFGLLLYFSADLISKSFFHEPELSRILKLFSISLPFYTFMTIASFSARIFRRMEYDVGLRFIVHPIIWWITAGAAYLLGAHLVGVIFGFIISSIFSAAIGIIILGKLFPELLSEIPPQFEVKKLLSFSLTVMLVGISSLLIYRVDRVMLGNLGAAEDVGIYNAAAIMAGQATIFLGSFNAILSPIISDLHNRGKIFQVNNLFKTTTKWVFTLTYPIVLIFMLFSKNIMGIYGKDFIDGWMVLMVLGFAQLCNAAVGSSGMILTMTGHQKMELINQLLLGGLNIILNFLLINRYSILGAALATGTSITLINLIRLIEVFLLYKIHPFHKSFWKPLVAGIIAGFVCFLIKPLIPFDGSIWVFGVMLFLLIYSIIFIVLGISDQEKLVVNAIVRKLDYRNYKK